MICSHPIAFQLIPKVASVGYLLCKLLPGGEFIMSTRVGFIGLGDIGTPMARRILDGGFDVISSANRRREVIEELKACGLAEANSPYDIG
jgi:glutamyl-tRNA reductase